MAIATIDSTNLCLTMRQGRRRRRLSHSQQTNSSSFVKLSRECVVFLLVVASKRSYAAIAKTDALTLYPSGTWVPTTESTLDATLASSSFETAMATLEGTSRPPLHPSDMPSLMPSNQMTLTMIPTTEGTFDTKRTYHPTLDDSSTAPTGETDIRQEPNGGPVPLGDRPSQYPTAFKFTAANPDTVASTGNSTVGNRTASPTLFPSREKSVWPTTAFTQVPTRKRKTIRPTPRPSTDNATLSPTMVDTSNRQDTPRPAGGGSIGSLPNATFKPTIVNNTSPTTLAINDEPTLQLFPLPAETEPTFKPTAMPAPPPGETDAPTISAKPTRPTETPTDAPSSDPFVQATPFPSLLPSSMPTTMSPTNSPTRPRRTASPSVRPSFAPSGLPTLSSSPTTQTPRPTASSLPSFDPSIIPTGVPSASATDIPSLAPSLPPTTLPSSTPSQENSLSLQNKGDRVIMTLQSVDTLEGLSIITWEQITAAHIRQSMAAADVDPPLTDLRVWTNIVQQTPQSPDDTSVPVASAIQAEPVSAPAPSGVRRRQEQQERALQQSQLVPLKIAFDTAVSYRSSGSDSDIQALIAGAFNTDEDRKEYVNSLKRTNDGAFQNLNEVVSVFVGGKVIPDAEESIVIERDDNTTMYIIIGAAAGGGALLLLIVFFFWRRYMSLMHRSSAKTELGSSANEPNGRGVTTEIVVEQNPDEVSTLGDPVYTPNGMMGMMMNTMERDERTASVSDDYDYKYLRHHNFGTSEPPRDRMMSEEARSRLLSDDVRSRLHSEESMTRESSGKTGTQSKLGLSQIGESIFSDDASFEEQYIESEQQVPFEITVPAGKLGMVIDTPNGGFPIVHAIKDTSILADRVRVGDRLVSVDGQDCTTMSAVQVSKLISLKSEQQSRVLVFVRNRSPRPGTPD